MKIRPKLKEELKRYLIKKQKEESEKVKITSSYRLDKEEISAILSRFPELKNKQIEQVVDDSIFAGVIISSGSKILDLSLRAKLKNLEKITHEVT